jgi:hypothetical protein
MQASYRLILRRASTAIAGIAINPASKSNSNMPFPPSGLKPKRRSTKSMTVRSVL